MQPSVTSRAAVRDVHGFAAGDSSWFDDLRAHLARYLPDVRHPRRWSRRGWAFATCLVLYLVTSILVIVPHTALLALDNYLVSVQLRVKHPEFLPAVRVIVNFGQRWMMTDALEVIIIWAALRARSIRPIVQFSVAIVLLNVSVGAVKYTLGRIGPSHQSNVHAFVFGGNIFPSGHVSNAVVLYGVAAMIVPQYRRFLTAFAVAASVLVGLGTVYLRTHWFSDVLAGWLAGAVVLLALPTVMPWAQRFADLMVDWVRDVVRRRPKLHRVAHAVLAFAKRVVPADPDFWLTGQQRRRLRRHVAATLAPDDGLTSWPDQPTSDVPPIRSAGHAATVARPADGSGPRHALSG